MLVTQPLSCNPGVQSTLILCASEAVLFQSSLRFTHHHGMIKITYTDTPNEISAKVQTQIE